MSKFGAGVKAFSPDMADVDSVLFSFRKIFFFCFTGIASGVMRRNNLTAKIPALWLLLSLRPLFPNVPWALAVGEFCRCSHWDWTPQLLSFWMVVVFLNIYVYVNTYMHIKTIYD